MKAQLSDGFAKYNRTVKTADTVRSHVSIGVSDRMQQEMEQLQECLNSLRNCIDGSVDKLEMVLLALEEFEADQENLRHWLEEMEKRVETMQRPLEKEKSLDELEMAIEVQVSLYNELQIPRYDYVI